MLDIPKAIAGGLKMVEAVGNETPPSVAANRAAVCAGCPELAKARIPGVGRVMFCGTVGPRAGETRSVCGCLVLRERADGAVRVDDLSMTAAGKLLVPDEACPQGKW